jgi:pimeloyl-ACP methyl ester carboxylesterase
MLTNTLSLPQNMQRELKWLRTGFQFLGTVAPNITGRIALNIFLTPRKRPITARARQLMQQAEQITIAHGSRQLAAYVWQNEGPTILLVHGWESNASGMRSFVQPLHQQGFRVVAFDGPAHGRSTGKQTNLIDYSGALETVIKTLAPVQAIVAHSFGAAATLFTLSREPNLGIERVVSIGAPSRLQEMVDIWTTFMGMNRSSVAEMRRKLVDRVGLPIEGITTATAVSQLTIPGLIIHDQADTVVPYSSAQAIHAHWPTSTLITTQGLDHRGPLQDREILRQVTTFLTEPCW